MNETKLLTLTLLLPSFNSDSTRFEWTSRYPSRIRNNFDTTSIVYGNHIHQHGYIDEQRNITTIGNHFLRSIHIRPISLHAMFCHLTHFHSPFAVCSIIILHHHHHHHHHHHPSSSFHSSLILGHSL